VATLCTDALRAAALPSTPKSAAARPSRRSALPSTPKSAAAPATRRSALDHNGRGQETAGPRTRRHRSMCYFFASTHVFVASSHVIFIFSHSAFVFGGSAASAGAMNARVKLKARRDIRAFMVLPPSQSGTLGQARQRPRNRHFFLGRPSSRREWLAVQTATGATRFRHRSAQKQPQQSLPVSMREEPKTCAGARRQSDGIVKVPNKLVPAPLSSSILPAIPVHPRDASAERLTRGRVGARQRRRCFPFATPSRGHSSPQMPGLEIEAVQDGNRLHGRPSAAALPASLRSADA
jgi:hypothetical protein